jgi:hypothetical protein
MKLKRERGAVMLATMIFVILFAAAAGSVLTFSLYSYRMARRNEVRAQAKAVADSEMDWIYYQFLKQILGGTLPKDTPAALGTLLPCDYSTVEGATVNPTANCTPYLKAHQDEHWIVRRSITWLNTTNGQIPDTSQRGDFTYLQVRVEVIPPPDYTYAESVSVRIGRFFSVSNVNVFQYAIFFEGDLEMAPGSDMTVTGDISANGSIYMGAPAGVNLTLINKVRYLTGDYFNYDPATETTVNRKPGTPGSQLPNYPTWGTSQADQVETMDKPASLVGGTDPAQLVQTRPDLFYDTNDVYRSVIAPPPDDATITEYPNYPATGGQGDEPAVASQRLYNRATLRITVSVDPVTGQPVVHYTKRDPDSGVDTAADGDFANTGDPTTDVVRETKNVYDLREGHNVMMTTINVANLNAKLATSYAADHTRFNGTVYVNLKDGDPSYPPAIRLINGETTSPLATTPSGTPAGFTVVTNGGVYVQGNYNTTQTGTNGDGAPTYNPTLIMGDAVTWLSPKWDDTNADNINLSARPGTNVDGTTYNGTINGGVLTGNIPADASHSSGGAQNLIRYLEDWYNPGSTVLVYGSIGRLFESKYFIRPYPGSASSNPTGVYVQPRVRNFSYDQDLKGTSPPSAPYTTTYSRGGYFNW